MFVRLTARLESRALHIVGCQWHGLKSFESRALQIDV
jgi:hypothetical protein